jgi:pimeloyl-ACP methyl ester carboxylesterase
LIFNFLDPPALRDNVLQSAVELILAAHLVDDIAISPARFDTEHMAIFGHSMGATIAPLAVAFEPRYRAMVLSGAGGSWIENVVYKEKPINVRPLAEQLLDYASKNRTLDEFDPVLTIVQHAIEPADPQVYAARISAAQDRHVLMLQGIVDHYIMPPIANALSLPLGLDLAGDSLDRENAETAHFVPLDARLHELGRSAIGFPVSGNRDVGGSPVTRVVVQNAEDGIEDGHEVVFQTDAPKALYRCFLSTFAEGAIPTVPAPDAGSCR